MDNEMKEAILQYIRDKYVDEDSGVKVDENTRLISGGLVDSFSLVSLLLFLRQRYKADIPDAEATPDAFDTVTSIIQLVEKYRKDK